MRSSRIVARRAFTLIELLVVIAIIGVLIGLLLPAVQKVREASARIKCANNMRQMALAVHDYQDSNDRFPYCTQDEGGWDWNYQQNARSWSWEARALPFMEQDPLYKQANIDKNTFSQSQAQLKVGVKSFFCPSDDAESRSPSTDRANLQGQPIANSNYKGVSGACWCWGTYTNNCTGTCNGLTVTDGAFARDDGTQRVTLQQITDGTSNTFLVGEDIPKINAHCAWPYANTTIGTCAIPPNVMAQPNGQPYDPYNNWPEIYSFRSHHPGGLQFAYADGSVHYIKESIALPVYRAMATIAGGEPMTDAEQE
jgi:prepilin-type N-terminal cleavage/methylation domain-containing protein/prepilin-type processing-associated H-X9-DG protein